MPQANDCLSEKITKRFWSKVNIKSNDECWEWNAGKSSDGYGIFRLGKLGIDRRCERSHRISWKLYNGDIPDDFMVCHKCDNPPCCNPNHLFLGTASDNLKDMGSKGRSWTQKNPERVVGNKNPNSHLSENDVINIIKEFHPRKITAKLLSIKYNTSEGYIYRILQGKVWKYIDRSEMKHERN